MTGDPTDPAEGFDPRVEAIAAVISAALTGWHEGVEGGTCPACQDVARDVLAAADAVDPLRQPGVIHRVAKRVSEPELATAYGHGWDDPQTWKREAWREEAHALLAAVDAVDPVRAEGFAALVALCERIVDRHYPHEVFTAEYSGPRDRGARFVAALHRALVDLDPEEGS